ncbi:hypothetical protein BN7_5955 [Wickerhamomyces ciferrii]|uniref:RRM domain-containing protein n=1 Tax=Wickerhamomyces ciferrii (strain ATCC 14091 / BCRC 22168 / CBS 111 / JCM 3599 / NBRC 0793 / NRRL Y-1031 F-60-10) TaxID=1206466 RepID=K0KWJ0_WICCF|nr:uncharacterized protein BN7_5955 [Wickerhamomyces ciferrii]CCH46362.1 hypothetical protein BN7_5955 [Wickerhamomyces ciferrii]
MMPYQKYPSIYKQYSQEQVPQVPQTPFDMAYGSSLLPRQLLVGSPFIQVQSPLPSPHHTSFRNHGSNMQNQNQTSYFMASPISAPKLNFPPESARRRGLNYHATLQRHNSSYNIHNLKNNNSNKSSSNNTTSSSNGLDDTPSKPKFKSSSSSSSSLNESTFDHPPILQDQHIYSGESGAISSNSSLYNLSSQQTLTKISSNFQISKNPTRSIILLNINQDLSITEFLNSITFGPIENVRIVENYPDEDHQSIVLAFLKIETCLNFYNTILTYLSKFKSSINSPDLSINFIATKKLLPFISNAINNDGATRNVYIGNLKSLNKEINEEFLYNEFSSFGLIDKIDLITKKFNSNEEITDTDETPKIDKDEENDKENDKDEIESKSKDQDQFAFIHFTNISSAIKAVEQLSLSPIWSNTKIFYGTDRCSINNNSLVLRSITDEQDEIISQISEENEDELLQEDEVFFENYQQQQQQQQQQQRPRLSHTYSHNDIFIPQQFVNDEYVSSALNQKNITARAVATNAGGVNNAGNRTVHLGNLDPKTKPEDICNVVRGGVLQQIKHFPNKKICFLTFIEPVAAAQFYANANIDGVTLHGRKLKIGWGNPSGPLPNSIALAVTVGASRNVYIGIKDEDLDDESLKLPNEEILREDFSKFGEIEQINFFKNDRCVFLNFLNIANAIKVVDDANGSSSEKFHEYFDNKYRNLKISFGKDRCGNPPKAKKSKKKKNKNNNNNINKSNNENQQQQKENGNDKSTEEQVEKLSEDFMNSMGITSTSNDKNEVVEENTEEAQIDTSNAFGISTTSTTNEEDVSKESDVNQVTTSSTDIPKDPEFYDSDSSSEALDIIVSKPEPHPYTPSRSSSEEYTSRVNGGKKNQRRPKRREPYSPAMSSRLSSASLNSLGYYPYEPETYVYKQVPFAPPPPPSGLQRSFSNVSRGSSRTNLSNFGTPRQQHPHLQHNQHQQQHYVNGFTTSGSQVMAQYLAQSQHANMIYAANVLNTTDDYGYEDDNAGYYHPGYNGRGGYRRR